MLEVTGSEVVERLHIQDVISIHLYQSGTNPSAGFLVQVDPVDNPTIRAVDSEHRTTSSRDVAHFIVLLDFLSFVHIPLGDLSIFERPIVTLEGDRTRLRNTLVVAKTNGWSHRNSSIYKGARQGTCEHEK